MFHKKTLHGVIFLSLAAALVAAFGCSQERDVRAERVVNERTDVAQTEAQDIKLEILVKEEREEVGQSLAEAPSADPRLGLTTGNTLPTDLSTTLSSECRDPSKASVNCGPGVLGGPGYLGGAYGAGPLAGSIAGAGIPPVGTVVPGLDVPVAPGVAGPWYGPGFPFVASDLILFDDDDHRNDDDSSDDDTSDDDDL